MKKVRILYDLLLGFYCKFKAWICIMCNIKPVITKEKAENTIISLTSYGGRIKRCAPYAIFSMYTQNMIPGKITLWIDKTKWNKTNLPFFIRRMMNWGLLEVNFCDDIRSFTKLLPALRKYPDSIIITIDDDLYYSKSFVRTLYKSYLKNKNGIHTLGGIIPTHKEKILQPYSQWKGCTKTYDNVFLLALGFRGILYPPHTFDEEIFNKDVFMKYAATCDDIWFYVMSLRMNKRKILVTGHSVHHYLIDLLYQKLHIRSGLRDVNIKYHYNDFAMVELLNYYNLSIEEI